VETRRRTQARTPRPRTVLVDSCDFAELEGRVEARLSNALAEELPRALTPEMQAATDLIDASNESAQRDVNGV